MDQSCIRQLTRSESEKFQEIVYGVTRGKQNPSSYRGKLLKRFGRTIYSVPLGLRKRILFESSCAGFTLKAVLTHEKYNRFITQKR
jgi:hypothetical protein